MKKILLTFAATAALLSVTNVFADNTPQNEVQAEEVAAIQAKTINQNLEELKEHLKDLAKIGSDKFNQTLSDTYDQMSKTVAEIKENAKDQKDKGSEKLQQTLDNISAKIEEYKKAGNKQQEKMRQVIIDKLEDLNKNIDEHNKEKAKAE
ncbi:MAG: hypothetical protein ACIPMY_02635 [Rickettsia endosymbiont of Pentastiridius leporinus]